MILFKNDNNYLPLTTLNNNANLKYAIIGPCANNDICYTGDYNGQPRAIMSPYESFMNLVTKQSNILFNNICSSPACTDFNANETQTAINIVKQADIIFYIGGISTQQEEETKDRSYIELPPDQSQLFKVIVENNVNKAPIVSILTYGAPVIDHYLFNNSVAVLGAGYAGEFIGDGVTSLLNGTYSPSARTTVTWYNSTNDLNNITSYDLMESPGRTYRYFNNTPTWPFGYGLSYVNFTYDNLQLSKTTISPCDSLTVNVELTNNGPFGKYGGSTADEIVMVYLEIGNRTYPTDNLRLVNFTRIEGMKQGAKQVVSIDIEPYWMSVVQPYYFNQVIVSGQYTVMVGGYLTFDTDNNGKRTYPTLLKQTFMINGDETNIKKC